GSSNMNSVFYILILTTLATAEDLSQGRAESEGTNFELTKGYTFNGLIDNSGKPGASAYAFLGGKLTQVPPSPNFYQAGGADAILAPPSTDSSVMSKLTTASYFAAGVVTALSAWYLCSLAVLPHSKKSTDDFKDKSESDAIDSSTDGGEKKSRRRRYVPTSNEEMTRLASIVLSAVKSGECLQKSICLLGTQVSGKKGKMADGLLSTLLPASIQQSDYYMILKKSLRGELSCEKFGCDH
ncbi:unnamed protein product, partial [Allacma fusca]